MVSGHGTRQRVAQSSRAVDPLARRRDTRATRRRSHRPPLDGSDSLGDWLQCSRRGRAGRLRAEAVERVAKFLECFPPLAARVAAGHREPAARRAVRGRVVLSGKVDLTLGRAEGARRRQGPHRPQDRRLLAGPPRRPALLRAARDAPARHPAPPAGQPTTSTRRASTPRPSPRTFSRGAVERTVRGAEAHRSAAIGRPPAHPPPGSPPAAGARLRAGCETGSAWLAQRARRHRLVTPREGRRGDH